MHHKTTNRGFPSAGRKLEKVPQTVFVLRTSQSTWKTKHTISNQSAQATRSLIPQMKLVASQQRALMDWWGEKSEGVMNHGKLTNKDAKSHWNSAAPWLVEGVGSELSLSPSRRVTHPGGLHFLKLLPPDESKVKKPPLLMPASSASAGRLSDWL